MRITRATLTLLVQSRQHLREACSFPLHVAVVAVVLRDAVVRRMERGFWEATTLIISDPTVPQDGFVGLER